MAEYFFSKNHSAFDSFPIVNNTQLLNFILSVAIKQTQQKQWSSGLQCLRQGYVILSIEQLIRPEVRIPVSPSIFCFAFSVPAGLQRLNEELRES